MPEKTEAQQRRYDALVNILRAGGDIGGGALENAMTIGSGTGAAAIGGLGGLGEMVAPTNASLAERLANARAKIEGAQGRFTYMPRSDVGQRGAENIGTAMEAATKPVMENVVDPIGEAYPAVGAGILAGAQLVGPKGAKVPKPRAALGLHPSSTAGRIVNETAKRGGYSVNLPSGELPTEGVMMGKYANTDPRNVVTDALTRAKVQEMVKTNAEALGRDDAYLGTWKSSPEEGGKTYVDVSRRFPADQLRQATKFGERTGQLSGYDVGKQTTVPVGNWKDFVQGPEFGKRLGEMQTEGRDYLSQFPAKEWWDMHGGPFERVYGQENLPQVAGFTASTAPNAQPRENLQTMSEYLRRHIKGEPTLQPGWRVPEGEMTRLPGKQIGMEGTRRANLEKSSRGDLGQLREDKVREEAAALMGDPNAVVLDRHWARLGEDPASGVYTSAAEGIIDPGKQYATLKNSVVEAAKKAGRDPRDFSADVWTGVRERIKRTNELYGQKYRKGSIQGESKSYADHFETLIEDKAKHLGITKAEMESRLRSGDATLMSLLGATTLLAPIFSEVMQEQSSPQPQPAGRDGSV